MQRRVCLARAEEEHGGGADGAEAAEVFGGAHGQGAGVVGNAFGIEGGGEGGDGLRGVFAVQEDVVIGEGQAKAVLCGGCVGEGFGLAAKPSGCSSIWPTSAGRRRSLKA
ncbi:hypothetical protein GOZ82_11220, partial [Agrobacterium vitis]|nr:hypothetical protein [Agrobacterium vitis]